MSSLSNLQLIDKMSGERKSKDKPSSSSEHDRQDDSDRSSENEMGFTLESVRNYLEKKLGFYKESEGKSSQTDDNEKVIEDLTFEGVANHWKKNGFKKIVTMVGAGISTSAGIPDFRSPGTGLYHNLEKYNLPHPTAIFEMDYFQDNPKPFFVLAKELYPGTFKPTPCHYFIRLLQDKGLLVRHYTQNIDTLERIAGVKDEKLVEAHGTFYTNHCLECRAEYSMEWMKEQIFADEIPICTRCPGVVKPDIVFFGENLPNKFYEYPSRDFKDCDLLIIMGTSLEVQPFASLVERANSRCIRLLINREKVGSRHDVLSSWLLFSKGLLYDDSENKRDVAWIGDCDDGVYALAEAIGWGDELKELVAKEHARIDKMAKGHEEVSDEEVEQLAEQLGKLGKTEEEVSREIDIQSASSGAKSLKNADDKSK